MNVLWGCPKHAEEAWGFSSLACEPCRQLHQAYALESLPTQTPVRQPALRGRSPGQDKLVSGSATRRAHLAIICHRQLHQAYSQLLPKNARHRSEQPGFTGKKSLLNKLPLHAYSNTFLICLPCLSTLTAGLFPPYCSECHTVQMLLSHQ